MEGYIFKELFNSLLRKGLFHRRNDFSSSQELKKINNSFITLPLQLLTLMFNYVSRIGPFWSAVLWVLTNVDSWVPPPRKCRAQFLPRERFSRVPSLWWSSICYCPYSFDFARISYRWNHSEFSLLSLAYSAWLTGLAIHLGCGVYEQGVGSFFYRWPVFHCANVLPFVYSFSGWETFWIVSKFWRFWVKAACCKHFPTGFHVGIRFHFVQINV